MLKAIRKHIANGESAVDLTATAVARLEARLAQARTVLAVTKLNYADAAADDEAGSTTETLAALVKMRESSEIAERVAIETDLALQTARRRHLAAVEKRKDVEAAAKAKAKQKAKKALQEAASAVDDRMVDLGAAVAVAKQCTGDLEALGGDSSYSLSSAWAALMPTVSARLRPEGSPSFLQLGRWADRFPSPSEANE